MVRAYQSHNLLQYGDVSIISEDYPLFNDNAKYTKENLLNNLALRASRSYMEPYKSNVVPATGVSSCWYFKTDAIPQGDPIVATFAFDYKVHVNAILFIQDV